MARKFARDNRGRFAPKGAGATARGGRLRTAGGNKRDGQTIQAKGGPKGTVGKPKGLKPAATNKISSSPRQLSSNERIARDVMSDKRFRSDRQRVAEMQRRGIKPGTDVVGLVGDVRSKQGGGTTGRIKPAAGSAAANNIEMAKGRSAVLTQQKASLNQQLKVVNSKIKEAGPSAGAYRLQKLQVQSRLAETRRSLSQSNAVALGDGASVNRPMAGARGRALNAEISRNVKQQKTQARSADKARNRQFKSDQSRAKKLREVHVDNLAKGYAARNPGRSAAEVKRRIGGMEPKDQIKLFRQYVKENRGTARKRK